MVSVLRASRAVAIAATDGYPLGATVFETRRARSTVVIHGATAVPQTYYAPFAEWLAATGVRVVTYDYRGVGASRRGRLEGFAATMTDWAERDALAVHAWAGDDVAMIGHSFGGQMIGLVEDLRDVRAAVLVACQLGYYGYWPVAQRARLWATWRVVLPAVVAAMGYLPGRLGLGEDLPAGVALEWARWCRDRDYLIGARPDAAARFARWTPPTMMIAIAGDPLAPARAIDALAARFTNAPLERRTIDEPFGHFGFFRPRASAHWADVAEFLREPAVVPFLTTEEIEEDLRYGR